MLITFHHQLISDWRRAITMDNELFVHTSIQIATLIYQRHDQQGVQGNLHTRKILVHSQTNDVSWNFNVERQPREYMAPEQFGIINRRLDVRSDLYSVGIILFELLFSALPYDLDGYEDWAHVHLYASPKQLANETNGPVYRIIEKLLSKSPDERYQTSYGLLYDLMQLRTLLEKKQFDQLNKLVLGVADRKQQLHLYDYLLVRKDKMEELEAKGNLVEAYKRSNIVLLHGNSGLGKTALLRQYQRRLQQVSQNALYIDVDSDNTEPYFFVKQLKQQLLKQLLQCDNTIIEAYVSELGQHLGPQLSLWLQLFPQAARLWHIELESVAQSETDTDMEFMLSTGLKLLIQILQPRTILIDASDQIDQASLHMVSAVLASTTSFPLYIVIATSSNMATEYRAALEHGKGDAEYHIVEVHPLELQPFSYEELFILVGHALSEHSTRIKRLCWAIYYWTKGIPNKIVELLEKWKSSGILYYDYTEHRWMWHRQYISNVFEADSSLSLHIDNFQQLQPATVQLLSYASVIGMQFSRSQLMLITETVTDGVPGSLADAMKNGIIAISDEQDDTERGEGDVQYIFLLKELHDHAYMKLSSIERAEIHLKLGFMNAEYNPELARSHWNKAVPIIDESMKQRVTQLNYDQAIHAFNRNDFRKAAEDFELALKIAAPQLLTANELNDEEPDERQLHMLLMLSISLSYSQQLDRSYQYFHKVEQYSYKLKGRDYLNVCLVKMEYNTFTNSQTSLSIGKEALEYFGVKLGTRINSGTALAEVIRTLQAVRAASKHPERLKFSDEPSYMAQCELMSSLVFAYIIQDPTAYIIHFSRFIRNGLKQGINQSLLGTYTAYEVILQRSLPDIYKLWPKDMLIHLHNLVQDTTSHTSLFTQFYMSVIYQLEDPLKAEENILKVIEIVGEHGHNILLNLASMTLMVISHGYPPHLEQFIEKVKGPFKFQLFSSTIHYRNLAIKYYDAWKDRDALHTFIQLQDNGEAEQIDNYIAIQRAEQAYLAKNFVVGMKWIEVARTNELSVDWIRNRRMRMYEALLAAELYRNSPHSMQSHYKRIVLRRAKRMHRWTGAYGANSAAHHVICAEACRLDNKYYKALLHYERAVKQAKLEGNELLVAIALEQLAYTYQEHEQKTGFYISLLDSLRAYKAWGATVKVNSLLESYPSLAQGSKAEPTVDEQEVANYDDQVDVEFKTRLQTTQQKVAVQPMTELDWTSLDSYVSDKSFTDGLQELMRTIKLHTGAEQAVLFHSSNASLSIMAHSEFQKEHNQQNDLVNMALVQYVSRVNEVIIVNNAIESVYATDSYIRDNQVKSLLCMPVLLAGRQEAILYLENRRIPHVFSQKSVDTIEMLNTRFAYLHVLQHPMQEEHHVEVSDKSKASPFISDVHPIMMEKLTARELEILQLIADGCSNKEIGDQLYVSEATVKSHVYKIYQKINVKRRAQAVSVARELKLIK